VSAQSDDGLILSVTLPAEVETNRDQ